MLPSRLLYHILQGNSRALRILAFQSRRKACISSCAAGTVYHQHEVLYIIKPQGKCTLKRDEIQGRLTALDDIHDCVGMILTADAVPKIIILPRDSGRPLCFAFRLLRRTARVLTLHENKKPPVWVAFLFWQGRIKSNFWHMGLNVRAFCHLLIPS